MNQPYAALDTVAPTTDPGGAATAAHSKLDPPGPYGYTVADLHALPDDGGATS
jgi:hypothetical protein